MFENGVRILEDLSYPTYAYNMKALFTIVFICGIAMMIGGLLTIFFATCHIRHCDSLLTKLRALGRKDTDNITHAEIEWAVFHVNTLKHYGSTNFHYTSIGLAVMVCGVLACGMFATLFGYSYGVEEDFLNGITHKYKVEVEETIPADFLEAYEILYRVGDGIYIVQEIKEGND